MLESISARIEQDAQYPLVDKDDDFPKVLRNLKVLKIGHDRDLEENLSVTLRKLMDHAGITCYFNNETSLDYLALPFDINIIPYDEDEIRYPRFSMGITFNRIFGAVLRRGRVDDQPKVKVADFINFHGPHIPLDVMFIAATVFPQMSEGFEEDGIKILNASSLWFIQRHHLDRSFFRWPLGIPIVSLQDLQPCVVPLEMPNLERIEIKSTSTNTPGPNWRAERKEWRALKQLDITVDSKKSQYLYYISTLTFGEFKKSTAFVDTKVLFQFLFQNVVRPAMEGLRLNFTRDAEFVVIPKASEIVVSCPNLKKLTLVNWQGKNKALIELFEGLPGLEEVSLENCKDLGNVAFVGTDTRSPVFFKLKKLKKLTLKGLDQMPKITDLLFTLVIRHLKLTHLTLTSDSPIKSISANGIRSLLEGSFAETIEKFPFQDFSLDGVSTEELVELEKQFRSYNMI